MKKSTGLFSRSYIAIFIINLIGGAYGVMSLSTMVSYCLSRGISDVVAGVVVAVLPMASFLFRPLSGMLCNRFGKRKLFYIGILCYAIPPLAFICGLPLWVMFPARALQGVGMSLVTTTAGAIVVGIIPPECFSAGIGIFSLGMTIAGSIAPGLALWLISRFGYNVMFASTILISLIAAALMPLVERREEPEQKKEEGSLLSQMYEKRSLIPTLLALAVGVIHVSVTQYLSVAAEKSGVAGDVSAFYVMSTIGIVLIRLLDVKLDRILNSRWKFIVGFGFEIAAGVLLSLFLPRHLAPVWIGFLYGVGYSLVWTLLNVLAVDGIEESRQGSANATFLAASDLSYFVGPLFWGFVCNVSGYGHIYSVAVVMMALCLLACLAAVRRRDERTA